ncbi:unnamed protein product [Phyllotreta striolata]|uniref:MD-2-related lipid-recognition domain-containing protein n=1 Tax=Phyllotreta striolata TaxID=444603 RepID=A0A9N9TM27_PHYSR|nr:unnamed protein product [Phyllotreta striolata]
MKASILVTLLTLVPFSTQILVNKCEGVDSVPSVNIISNGLACEAPPCPVFLGAVAEMQVNFSSSIYFESLKPNITVIALGAVVPVPPNQQDGCEGILNTVCPVVAGETIDYIYKLQVYSFFPKIEFTVIFSMVNELKELVTCFSVDLLVKSKN